jgi:hypothetical protein
MDRNTQRSETPADKDQAPVTIKLPDDVDTWDDSTIYLERIHDMLAGKGWGRGPI